MATTPYPSASAPQVPPHPNGEQWVQINKQLGELLHERVLKELRGPHAEAFIKELVQHMRVEHFILKGPQAPLDLYDDSPLGQIFQALTDEFQELLKSMGFDNEEAAVDAFAVRPYRLAYNYNTCLDQCTDGNWVSGCCVC